MDTRVSLFYLINNTISDIERAKLLNLLWLKAKEINIERDEFINICDKFTNKSLFICNNKDELIKDKEGNLILKNNDYK